MNRKILSAAVLALAATFSASLAQAGHHDDDDDNYREVRVHEVERHYSRHDNGEHRGWYGHEHHGHHEYYEHRDYYEPAPRGYRESYPERRASSPVPIIAGSVIGGVVGHEIGRGDPRDTAVGAVIGTIIGYEIVRNR